MKNKKFRILLQILKNSTIYKLIIGYVVFFAIVALLMFVFEPTITTYRSSLWYCFVSCTTIGFGDIIVTTAIGKILTVVLYLYSVVILAIVTAVITQYFLEVSRAKRDESTMLFLNDLENLSSLPKERLDEISENIKKMRNK